MQNPFKPGTPEAFFWEHAGYSYRPETETPEQGRESYARKLADAERRASEAGVSYLWDVSDIDSSDFDDSPDPWRLWDCRAILPKDSKGWREIVGSLGAVDFGRDGEPWGDPYARVVHAEIVLGVTLPAETDEDD